MLDDIIKMIYSNKRHFNMSNISLPYKTLKRNAFQIKFQQNGAFAESKMVPDIGSL